MSLVASLVQLQREASVRLLEGGVIEQQTAMSARQSRRDGLGARDSTRSEQAARLLGVPKALRGQTQQDRGRGPHASPATRATTTAATVAVRPPPPRTPVLEAQRRIALARASPACSRARRDPRRSASRFCRPLAAGRAGGEDLVVRSRSASSAPRAPPSQRRSPPGRPPAPRIRRPDSEDVALTFGLHGDGIRRLGARPAPERLSSPRRRVAGVDRASTRSPSCVSIRWPLAHDRVPTYVRSPCYSGDARTRAVAPRSGVRRTAHAPAATSAVALTRPKTTRCV